MHYLLANLVFSSKQRIRARNEKDGSITGAAFVNQAATRLSQSRAEKLRGLLIRRRLGRASLRPLVGGDRRFSVIGKNLALVGQQPS